MEYIYKVKECFISGFSAWEIIVVTPQNMVCEQTYWGLATFPLDVGLELLLQLQI